jgi:hypothetical protein
MNLKNRFVAITTAAVIAIPALAFAAGKISKAGDSNVDVTVTAGPGKEKISDKVELTFHAKTSSIDITDDGNNVIVKVDTHNFKTGMGTRDKHMKEQVFNGSNRYVELIVPSAAVEKALAENATSLNAKVKGGWMKSGGDTADVKITSVKMKKDGDKVTVTGTINTTLGALKINNVPCQDLVLGSACVRQPLIINGTLVITKK